MYGRRRALVRPGLTGVMLVAAFAWACGDGLQDVMLLEPETQPLFNHTTGSGVVPVLVAGNPTCTTLNSDDANFPTITSNFGFKVEGVADWNGTYQLTNADGALTGGALDDPGNSITISNSDGTFFDWASTLSLDAVIVKGGTDGNAYVYDPESFSDTGLHSPNNPSNGTPYAISHIEFCYDYELVAEKTADAVYMRTYTWEIAKDVAPASHTGFIGQSFTSDYTVAVDQTVVDSDWAVTGDIIIDNPTPFDVTFSVTDNAGGTAATVSCPTATLAAGANITCTYTAALPGAVDDINTATVTVTSPAGVQGATAVQAYAFGEPTTVAGYPSIDVTDTNGFIWTTDADAAWSYTRAFDCPTDASLYAGGVYAYSTDNTAEITETGQSDTETVVVTCYALTVTKDAATEWFRRYDWSITKDVAPASHVGFPGDAFTSGYTVFVDQTISEYGWRAYGTISVTTPADAPGDITVAVADAVNGTSATVDCGGGATTLTVSPGVAGTCDYTVDLTGTDPLTNTAQISYNGLDFAATAPVTFGEPTIVGEPTINVTDYFDGGAGDALGTASDDKTFTYSQGVVCPTDLTGYVGGVYTDAFPNYAEIDETGDQDNANVDLTCYEPAVAQVLKTTTEGPEEIGQFPFSFELYDPSGALVETQTLGGAGTVAFTAELKAEGLWTIVETLPEGWVAQGDTECTFEIAFPGSAAQTYSCSFDNVEESRVDLLKLTNGQPTTVQTWTFQLYEGPDGFEGTLVASDATPPTTASGLLEFGNVDLDPFATYTLCEREVPAGYSTFWQVDTGTGFATVVPYNPNADDDPPEDLGNRCVDFGAGTGIALTSGETIHFMVDNQAPGGDPRTPGYWKNWNTCTGGNQQNTAAANGGWQEGFWLLENVLDPSIGGGVIWDDILSDTFVFPINGCALAVDILDKREVANQAVVGDGKKAASDPLFNLATHLLAAQLNFGAGACVTQEVLDAALDAETLLDQYDFDGDGHNQLQRRSPDVDLANQLATYLDDYNNGMFCGSTNGN